MEAYKKEFIEFMVDCQVDIVSSVIFIWEPFTVVDTAFGKLTITFG